MDNPFYDFSPTPRRPRLELPNGARVAFWAAINIEYYPFGRPGISISPPTASMVPDPANQGWRDYGPRVGVWRLMAALDANGMRASVLLNSEVCAQYPEIIEEGNKRKWAWLAHGKNNSILQVNMSEVDERKYLDEMLREIESGTGRRPKGWLGPALSETDNTTNLLAELGVTYNCDWCCDDQPFPMHVKTGKMISVPYSVDLNDITLFFNKNLSGDDFYQLVVDQFDVLYREGSTSGRVMALCLHPFIINQPFRQKYLEKALAYVSGHDGVWLATSDEIAEWYYERYYSAAVSNRETAPVGR